MGIATLGEVLQNVSSYEPDILVYVPAGDQDLTLFTQVLLLKHGAHDEQEAEGHKYFLETGVMAEVLDGLAAQLSDDPTPSQSLRAVQYYAEHDAFPDIAAVE